MKKKTNKTKKNIKYKKGGMEKISPVNFDSTLSSHSVSQKLLNEDSTSLRDTKTKWLVNSDFAKALNRYINIKYSEKSEEEKKEIFEYLKKNKQTQQNYQTSVFANNTVNPRLFYSRYNSEFDKLYKDFGGKVLKKQNKTRKYKKGGGLMVSKIVNDYLDSYYPRSKYITPNSSIASIESNDNIPINRHDSIEQASITPTRIPRTPPRHNLNKLLSSTSLPNLKFPELDLNTITTDKSLSELWDNNLMSKIKNKGWNRRQINHALSKNPYRYNINKTMKERMEENQKEWYNPRQPEFGGKK